MVKRRRTQGEPTQNWDTLFYPDQETEWMERRDSELGNLHKNERLKREVEEARKILKDQGVVKETFPTQPTTWEMFLKKRQVPK
jgi:hypothetical protein